MLTYGHDNGRISDHILASWPITRTKYKGYIVDGRDAWKKK